MLCRPGNALGRRLCPPSAPGYAARRPVFTGPPPGGHAAPVLLFRAVRTAHSGPPPPDAPPLCTAPPPRFCLPAPRRAGEKAAAFLSAKKAGKKVPKIFSKKIKNYWSKRLIYSSVCCKILLTRYRNTVKRRKGPSEPWTRRAGGGCLRPRKTPAEPKGSCPRQPGRTVPFVCGEEVRPGVPGTARHTGKAIIHF